MMVAVVALARSFHKARCDGDYSALADGSFRGAVGSAATIAAVGALGAVGGPTGAALLVGITAGMLVNKATASVSITDVGRFVASSAAAVTVRESNGHDNDSEVAESHEPKGS